MFLQSCSCLFPFSFPSLSFPLPFPSASLRSWAALAVSFLLYHPQIQTLLLSVYYLFPVKNIRPISSRVTGY